MSHQNCHGIWWGTITLLSVYMKSENQYLLWLSFFYNCCYYHYCYCCCCSNFICSFFFLLFCLTTTIILIAYLRATVLCCSCACAWAFVVFKSSQVFLCLYNYAKVAPYLWHIKDKDLLKVTVGLKVLKKKNNKKIIHFD